VRTPSLGGTLAAALGLAVGAIGSAPVATFQFSPVRVNLTARAPAASILLTNPTTTPLRMEARAFRWTQRTDGKAVLAPSDAILVFPQLLTIPANGQRRVRVATTDAPGDREGAYRVAIASIGTFSSPATRGTDIQLLLQANLPVYVAPKTLTIVTTIVDAHVANATLAFAVANGGTVHVLLTAVRVSGRGQNMQPMLATTLDGGDVLAGMQRIYLVPLPRATCRALRSFTIQLNAGDKPVTQTGELTANACGP
jgi:P pilus assembly chaperone PapD